MSGTVEVLDPAGDTVLDETFDLAPAESEEEDASSGATYDDVWTDAGSYDVSIELTDVDIDGTSRASETVTIEDPGEEMLGIALGAESEDAPIVFRVGESLSDFAEE